MIDESTFGRRLGADTLRFDRTFDAPNERVWRALTTPEGLEPWLGSAVVDLRIGGTFTVNLTPENVMDGYVAEFDPPHELVISWHEIEDGAPLHYATTADDRSELSFTLEARGTGTSLVLVHRLLRGGEVMSSFGAGWHAILGALGARLAGHEPPPFTATYEMLHHAYARALTESC